MRKIFLVFSVFFVVSTAFAAGPGNTDLSFTNPATNESGVEVERHEGICSTASVGQFTKIATLPKDATTGKDLTTVAGKVFCYRVRVFNNSMLDGSGVMQYSTYSNEAAVTYPLAPPDVAPSGLTAQ